MKSPENTQATPPAEPCSDAAVGSTPRLAWEVEINSMTCICFATTKAKAQWIATKSYWEAYGRRLGVWPRAKAWRKERYDKSRLATETHQQAWSRDHVENTQSR
jgi:hypothetical protein